MHLRSDHGFGIGDGNRACEAQEDAGAMHMCLLHSRRADDLSLSAPSGGGLSDWRLTKASLSAESEIAPRSMQHQSFPNIMS